MGVGWDVYSSMEKHINHELLVLFHVLSHSRACLDICQKNFYESVFHKLLWNSPSMGSLTLGQANVVLIQHGQGKLLHKVDLCDSTRKLLHKSALQPVRVLWSSVSCEYSFGHATMTWIHCNRSENLVNKVIAWTFLKKPLIESEQKIFAGRWTCQTLLTQMSPQLAGEIGDPFPSLFRTTKCDKTPSFLPFFFSKSNVA